MIPTWMIEDIERRSRERERRERPRVPIEPPARREYEPPPPPPPREPIRIDLGAAPEDAGDRGPRPDLDRLGCVDARQVSDPRTGGAQSPGLATAGV